MLKNIRGNSRRLDPAFACKTDSQWEFVVWSRECVLVCLVASVMSSSLWPHRLYLARLLCPWDSLGRILEWVVMLSSGGSFQPSDQTLISCISCVAGGFLTHWATWEAGSPRAKPVLCDNLEGWDREGGGRAVQERASYVWFMSMYVQNHCNVVIIL